MYIPDDVVLKGRAELMQVDQTGYRFGTITRLTKTTLTVEVAAGPTVVFNRETGWERGRSTGRRGTYKITKVY